MSHSWIGCIALAVMLQGCAMQTAPSGVDLSTTSTDAVDAMAAFALDESQIPGMSVVVLLKERTALARGYGHEEAGGTARINERTVFQLGSIGKQFLASLVLKLVEEGRLSLDDSVVVHLPDFRQLPASLRIRHLLNHTSGIRELFTQPEYGAGIENLSRTAAELTVIARQSPVDFAPGTRWSYSNTNYTILALLVERLTGTPYEVALTERLFQPLGLSSLRQCTPLPVGPGEARGHVLRKNKVAPSAPENMNWIRGDGGICGSALDLARWTRLLATGRVVSSQSQALMAAPTRLTDGREVEYGFALSLVEPDGRRKVAHGGAMLGFSAMAAYYPDTALTVVVLTNRGDVRTESIERKIARRLLGLPPPVLRDRSLTAEQRQRFVGRYDIGVFEVSVSERDGRLWLQMPRPGPTTALVHLGNGEFVGEADPDAYGLVLSPGEGSAQELLLLMGAMRWYGIRRD